MIIKIFEINRHFCPMNVDKLFGKIFEEFVFNFFGKAADFRHIFNNHHTGKHGYALVQFLKFITGQGFKLNK
jgi:hypothetical protein